VEFSPPGLQTLRVAAPASTLPASFQAVDVSRRRWAVLAVLCLALLVTGIDGTIVNVALPSLVRELHTSSSDLQWVVDAYTIVFASFLLIAGNTGDRLGRKACFVAGMMIFGAGSLACALVDTSSLLIVMRGLQGFGAAFIMPSTLSILSNVFTDDAERARAISIWAGVTGLGVAIGPLAGGLLLAHFWWGSVFFVNVPIIAVAIIGAIAIVPDSRDVNAPRLDLLGALLSTVGLIALLYGIIEGPSFGWGSSKVVAAFAAAAVLLTGFVLWEQRTDHPILEISFFRNPRFTAASISITLVFFAMFGCLFFMSQYLQFVLGLSPLGCGVRLLPVAGVLMISAPASAKLVARFGTKLVVASGLVLVTVALVIFSATTVSSGYGLVAVVLVVIGAGMGLAMAPATDSIMGSLPLEKAGVGSAMNDTTREIGGALGVGILGSITTSLYASRFVSQAQYRQLAATSASAAAAAKSSIGGAAIVAAQLPVSFAHAVTDAANAAFVHALDTTALVAAAVSLLGAIIAATFLPARAGVADDALAVLLEGAAQRLDPRQVQSLAKATLDTLADAGMASLTYSGIAARSGVGVATLQKYWTSRVDAVTEALREVVDDHPIPDTGDLRQDLRTFLSALANVLSDPRNRQVIGALVSEAARSPELAVAFRERVIGPRRAQLIERLAREPATLRVPAVDAVDMLVGPLYHRAMIADAPLDDEFLASSLECLLASAPRRRRPPARAGAAPAGNSEGES
jgi:EmrB/QacA subfamily drug resistance transporter